MIYVRQPRTVTIAVFLILLLSLMAQSLSPGSAQTTSQGAATTAAARNTALSAATQEVLKETSELRQLSILRAVESSTKSRPEIEQAILKNLDEGASADDLRASELVLKRLGMAPPDFQYRALLVRVLTEQVAGYYDPKTQRFHLADWIDVDGQKPVMAHELTHALQDQHFNLGRFEHWPKGDSDAELAAHALIEGDATLAMLLYVQSNPLRALAFLKSMALGGVATEELNKAPRALRETLLFPYQEGLTWARSLHQKGGWPEVSLAFKSLPQSTEQILHPEKFMSREAPVKVTLPDLAKILNGKDSKKIKSGAASNQTRWKRIMADINGEWSWYLILDQFLKTSSESRAAAAGWAGDRYELYEGPQGETLYFSKTVWDSENDATEFFDAFVKRVQLRYPETTSVIATPKSPARVMALQTPDGIVVVELQGARVMVSEGITNRSMLNLILRSSLNVG
jgi:hypothetical protein